MRVHPYTTNILGVLAASAMLVISGEVSAQTIIPLDQQRSVNTFLIVPQCFDKTFDEDSAKGFEPFDRFVETRIDCDSGVGFGVASQQSQVGASSVTSSGRGLSAAGVRLSVIADSCQLLMGARLLQAAGGAAVPGLGMTLAIRA